MGLAQCVQCEVLPVKVIGVECIIIKSDMREGIGAWHVRTSSYDALSRSLRGSRQRSSPRVTS